MKLINVRDLEELIGRMQQLGSSLTMNWAEDDHLWCIDWITGGVRYSGTSLDLTDALLDAVWKARASGHEEKQHEAT